MKKKLFKVEYVNQQTGDLMNGYFLADGLADLEDEIADITEIYPLIYEVLGSEDTHGTK